MLVSLVRHRLTELPVMRLSVAGLETLPPRWFPGDSRLSWWQCLDPVRSRFSLICFLWQPWCAVVYDGNLQLVVMFAGLRRQWFCCGCGYDDRFPQVPLECGLDHGSGFAVLGWLIGYLWSWLLCVGPSSVVRDEGCASVMFFI